MDETVIFELYQTIGHGGQADVFLARQQASGIFYAAKVLREAWDPWAVAGFRKEVLRHVRAAGSRLVQMVAWNFDTNPPFAILEYMPGGSLADRMDRARGQRWAAERALGLVRDLASGLAELHAANVLHLDVKPANILFDASGQAFLNDLGVGATCSPGRVLVVGGFRGTPQYAAPEQLAGVFSDRCDVYPLGAILYELLAGRPLARNVRARLPISMFRHDIEPEVDELVRRLAHPDYRYRPNSLQAAELLQREIYRIPVRAAMRRANPLYRQVMFR